MRCIRRYPTQTSVIWYRSKANRMVRRGLKINKNVIKSFIARGVHRSYVLLCVSEIRYGRVHIFDDFTRRVVYPAV